MFALFRRLRGLPWHLAERWRGIVILGVYLFFRLPAHPVHAAALPGPIQDTIALANDALTWILALVPAVGGAMLGYYGLVKQAAGGDPHKVHEANAAMKSTLIGTAIAESAAGLVKIITDYYSP